MFDRRFTFWILFLPPLIWLAAFFLFPLLLMAAFSFRADTHGRLFSGWVLSFIQYANVWASSGFLRLLGLSSVMALAVSLIVVLLSYPLAYFLAIYARQRMGFYLVLLLVPFWTSYLLRVMAWKIMLGSNGVINSMLLYVHVMLFSGLYIIHRSFIVMKNTKKVIPAFIPIVLPRFFL